LGKVDVFYFFSSRRRHTSFSRDWSSDVALPILLPWLLMLIPTDIYRLLNIVAFGDSGQLSGVLSLGTDLPIGAAGLWLGLILWCAIPLAGALLLFKNRRI